MPYIDLVSSDDYASIWYFAHTPNGNVGSFDPEKPTIIMLHPLFLDSTWLHPQFDDQRLYSSYNLVVFDTRSAGKSLSRYNGRYDLWVGAADLALAIQVCSDSLSLENVHGNKAHGVLVLLCSIYICRRLTSLLPSYTHIPLCD